MTIFSERGAPERDRPLNTRTLALEQLISIHGVTSDLRWAMVELAWRSLTALFAFAQGHLRTRRQPRQDQADRSHCCC